MTAPPEKEHKGNALTEALSSQNLLTVPPEKEHKGNALTEALSSLVEGGAELARRREFIYTKMR